MGVSGSGKSTIGKLLAARLGWTFAEGDDFHSPAEVAKMKAGQPLDDRDRAPWLAAIAAQIDAWRAAGTQVVVSCSALKRAYRDVIIGARPDVGLVYLAIDPELAKARLSQRHGHFMPPSLLPSQLATLEPPTADEHPITADVNGSPEQTVARVMAQLGRV